MTCLCMQPEVCPGHAQAIGAQAWRVLGDPAGPSESLYQLQQLALGAPGGGGALLRRSARPGVWELVGRGGVGMRTPRSRRGCSEAARAGVWQALLPELAGAGLRPVAAVYARAPCAEL